MLNGRKVKYRKRCLWGCIAILFVTSIFLLPLFGFTQGVPLDTEIIIIDIDPSIIRVDDTLTVRFYSNYSNVQDANYSVWVHDWTEQNSTWLETPYENNYHENVTESIVLMPVDAFGNYSFTLSIPDRAPFSNGESLELHIILEDYDAEATGDFNVVPASYVSISGFVKDTNENSINDAFLNFWNGEQGGSDTTDENGFYSTYVPASNYSLNIWPPMNSSLGGLWVSKISVFFDMEMNVTLLQRLIVEILGINPEKSRVSDEITVDLSISDEEHLPVTGLNPDLFKVWIHDWSDPDGSSWWGNPVEDGYHDRLTDDVSVIEMGGGLYRFSYTIPDALPFSNSSGWLDMQVRVGDGESWRGFQVLSGNVYMVSGYVKHQNGTIIERAGVELWSDEHG
jgi:protocatechuate 3,4-dioxygenase beta subunit